MDFLDKIFFDNTIKSYLVVGGIILFILIFKRFVSRYLAILLYELVRRVWKTVSKTSFIEMVVVPLEWFIVILIAVFAIDKLHFPTILLFTLYGYSTADILSRAGTGIIIVSFILLVLRLMDFIAMVLEEKALLNADTRDNQLIVFVRDLLKVVIGILGVLLIIKACFNQPLGNLLTGLSIVGAALALGAKESLENLIASFIIFSDKPFFAGDTVKVNNIIGTVEKIGLRSTRIRTGDKTLVTVPNKQMVDSVVDNWSMRTQRRAEIKLELSAKTPLQSVEELLAAIREILAENSGEILSSTVFLKEYGKNGLLIVTEYFTRVDPLADFDLLKQQVNIKIKAVLEEKNIEFTGNTSNFSITQ